MITAERLRDVLDYDPETGIFRWKARPSNRVRIGDIAGCLSKGYVKLRVDGTLFMAHRLAWLYVHGEWPEDQIDHINCDPSDNSIGNLRLATNAENVRNTRLRIDNTSGFKGVCWHRKAQKWAAEVRVNGQKNYLGLFKCKDDAVSAYRKAAKRLHGEFARVA